MTQESHSWINYPKEINTYAHIKTYLYRDSFGGPVVKAPPHSQCRVQIQSLVGN